MEPSADSSTGRVGIVAPLPEEVAPLLRRLRRRGVEVRGGRRYVSGRLSGRKVLVAVTGDGSAAAGQAAEALLEELDAELLLATGVCGGLSSDLEVGAIVVARAVLENGREAPPPDPDWLARALRVPGARPAVVVCSRRIAVDPAEKGRLLELAGDGESAAVDLESAAFAEVAHRRGVPYLVVRAVSDTAEDELPLDFNRCLTPAGGVSRSRVALHALLHPGTVPGLLLLRRRVARCARRLAVFLEEVLS